MNLWTVWYRKTVNRWHRWSKYATRRAARVAAAGLPYNYVRVLKRGQSPNLEN